ncbi:hypothetical protein MSIM_36680 [Mycobacterium simiae]|nr:hypothetical protein MSIM_36680 [Mycobacterium simiae]
MDVEFLGDLLGEFGMRPPGEQHQIFAIVGPVVAHRAALAVRVVMEVLLIVRSESYGMIGGLPATKLMVSIRIPVAG